MVFTLYFFFQPFLTFASRGCRLPEYACKFLEMCLMVTADHGPAVSGAHNTIITARAGKDLVSSLASGILTIGDRFGGALDGAAQQFRDAYDSNMVPMEFVNSMRKQHRLIMGIGHKVKSVSEWMLHGYGASFLRVGCISGCRQSRVESVFFFILSLSLSLSLQGRDHFIARTKKANMSP